jgi:hypothetical protein
MAETPLDRNRQILIVVVIVILAGVITIAYLTRDQSCTDGSCGIYCPPGPLLVPVFPDPEGKILDLSAPAFTRQLYGEAVAYEPLLGTPGTQVHMGFWSGPGNHGSVLRLIDDINEGPAHTSDPPNRAIWDEGVNAYYHYPSYAQILDEHWYERAGTVNGTVQVFGKSYPDPNPVTIAQADEIWGEYSARYTDMIGPIAEATGNPVKVWCYIQGAKADQIFYRYEFSLLQQREQEGACQVYFARDPQADWTKPGDWLNGTANAPGPAG